MRQTVTIRASRKASILAVGILILSLVITLTTVPSTEAETFSSPRMGKATVTVLDANGNPCPNATIQFNQTTHDFLFGVGMTGPQGNLPYWLFPEFQKIGVNFLMPAILWSSTEPQPGVYTWGITDNYRLAELQQLGYTMDGQLLIFFFDYDWCIPEYLKNMTYNEILEAVDTHVYTVASYYAGIIKYWDINEPADPRSCYFNFTQQQWVEIVRTAGQAIRRADPDARILVNLVVDDHDGWTPHGFLDALVANNVEFDDIGLEIYIGMVPSDENGYPDVNACSEKIHTFDRFNKPVIITEIAIPDTPSQQTQADWLKSFYSMAFQIPSVKSICYYYTVDDGGLTSGLYPDANSPPRLIYYALGDIIKNLTSNGSVTTGTSGDAMIEGYAGDYQLLVNTGDKVSNFTIHINEGEARNVSLNMSPLPTPTPTTTLPTNTPSPNPTASPSQSVTPLIPEFSASIVIVLVPILVSCVLPD